LVIERALFLDDTTVLVKAYLRRGLAYESLQQYESAIIDLSRVKELSP
jgi:regulator of sirC expression with transglutaminase-like and TPR domain